jgi:predicted GIY-YIG superfamily endonuclease
VNKDGMTYLYMVHNLDRSAVLYVGITNDLHTRMLDHKRNQPWADEVGDVDYWRMVNRREALAAEYVLIDRHQPIHNLIKRRIPPRLQVVIDQMSA